MSQMPPPLRVEPLGYQIPAPIRPGILTAVGVVSISIASLTILTGCGGVAYAFVFGMMTNMRRTIFVPPVRTMTTAAPTPTFNPRGMPVEQRRIVVAALSGRAKLSPARQAMLDKLLAENGANMFFGTQYDVAESGRLPNVGDQPGNDYLVIGLGRIELADDQAIFSPTNGETVRVYSNASSNTAINNLNATPTPIVFPPGPIVSPTSAIFYGVISLCNVALAIFLLIIGILVLRNSPRARSMHLIYAVLKIPFAIVAAVAYALMMSRMMSGFAMPSTSGPVSAYMTISAAIQGSLACAYPIALLIVMNRPLIKEYYSERIAR